MEVKYDPEICAWIRCQSKDAIKTYDETSTVGCSDFDFFSHFEV
jgi:hypothetical protein